MADKVGMVLEIGGRRLLTVSSTGEQVYADGYNAERVIEELSVFSLEALGAVESFPEAQTDDANVYGIYLSFRRGQLTGDAEF